RDFRFVGTLVGAQKGQRLSSAKFVIQAHDLQRRFSKNVVVDGLTLSIPQGELFGLVGPDGAGKTTILRLFTGLLKINNGNLTVLGHDLRTDPEGAKPRVGYMAQQFNLYGDMSVVENLRFFADLFDVKQDVLGDRMQRLLDFAGLKEFTHRPTMYLSGGMQKKLALACTLIHQPDILLLDEPTTGVDPISRREFWDILVELHIQGITILVSTPYMDEADRCERVGLLYQGKMIKCDSPIAIRRELIGDLLEIYTGDWRTAKEVLKNQPGVLEVQTYGEALRVLVDRAEERQQALEDALSQAKIEIISIRRTEARMEDVFISLIKKLEE
ncbi:MAG: ATP-binding cassette domain-containing protein, partial [Anaerolineales bacterium]